MKHELMTGKKTGVRSFSDQPLGEEYEGAEKGACALAQGWEKKPERYLKGTPNLILNICL